VVQFFGHSAFSAIIKMFGSSSFSSACVSLLFFLA